MTRVLMIVNDIDSQPRRLLPRLIAHHIDVDIRIGPGRDGTWNAVPGPEAVGAYDGFVYLGGGLMPDETDRAPWLADEAALAQAALEADKPQLGICLGGQLLAHITGGEVRAQTGAPEKGATAITMLPAAVEDPVFGQVSRRTHFIESHVDRITALPPEATLLASSELCEIQAFRVGRSWGMQFHPEASAESVRGWEADKLAALGFDKDTLVAEADAVEATSARDAQALFDAFAQEVIGTGS